MNQQNRIIRFLLFSAGSSIPVLQKCPESEWIKHSGIGGTVLLTALLASLSSFYAFQQIFPSVPICAALALLWGTIIFNLDRYIVSSFRKQEKPLKEFFTILPRMILALMISLIISKPLELEIFRSEVNEVLDK
jgi:hypothetical protein